MADGAGMPEGGARETGGADGGAAGAARPSVADLRRTVAALEGRIEAGARLASRSGEASGAEPAGAQAQHGAEDGEGGRSGATAGRLVLGVPGFDALFGGGLPAAALTEIRSAETRVSGALTGFLCALLASAAAGRSGPVLWARETRVSSESGRIAALGLVQMGIDPSRLLLVEADDPAGVLWAAEEGLGCVGVAAVVAEVQGLPKALDLTASRRLSLRARDGGVPMLLAGHAMAEAASAAAVRLAVAPRPSRPAGGFAGGPGFPAWSVTVEKNRDGRPGRLDLEWNTDDRRFRALAPDPVAVAAAPADRPARPPQAGQVVAHPAFAGRR